MKNIFSVDVEDYWSIVSRDWLGWEIEPTNAVVKSTQMYLEMFFKQDVKATFFILGEVAKKAPSLVKKIADNGHELAVHGYYHKQIFKLTREEFRKEISKTKKLVEDIASVPVLGHRAPAYSVVPHTGWALEVLAEEGFAYDSSIYPIRGSRYGWPGFCKDVCIVDLPGGKSIIEFPLSTVTILGKDFAMAGGGYLRHFPYLITKWAIKSIQKKRPAIVYVHPCEIDTDAGPCEVEAALRDASKDARRFYVLQLRNRHTGKGKVEKLLRDFRFTTFASMIGSINKDTMRRINICI